MKATGIVRRIDDLGRIVIPKEIRQRCHIKEGDPLEIFVSEDKEIVFKLYQPFAEPWRLLEEAAEQMRDSEDFHVFASEVFALAKKIKKSTY